MTNSLEYTFFVHDFVENILLSLNLDYHHYIDFNNKNGILNTKVDCYELDHTVSLIAYNLLINGKQQVFLYDINDKVVISLIYSDKEKLLRKFVLKFPKQIMSDSKRKNILKKLKKMKYLDYGSCNDEKFPQYNLYIMDLVKRDYDVLTKDFVSIRDSSKSSTDFYYLFREIRKRKSQKILINYIFDKLNYHFHKVFNNLDSDDIIIFKSHSLEELNILEDDLLNNKRTVSEVNKKLNPRIFK